MSSLNDLLLGLRISETSLSMAICQPHDLPELEQFALAFVKRATVIYKEQVFQILANNWLAVGEKAAYKICPNDLPAVLKKLCEPTYKDFLAKVCYLSVSCGIDLNTPLDDSGATMMHLLVQAGRVDDIQKLLDNQTSCTTSYANGRNAVQEAVFCGQRDVVELFLNKDPALVNFRSSTHPSLLHIACQQKREAVITLLLSRGHDPLPIDSANFTPFHTCAEVGFLEGARLLLQKTKKLPKDRADMTPLHYAAREGHVLFVQEFCRFGIDDQNSDGRTALSLASARGHCQVIAALLDGGAKQLPDNEGKAPLHYATECNKFEAATLLVQRSASIHSTTKKDWTVLHYAARTSLELCRLFLDNRVKIDAVSDEGMTCLHNAILAGLDDCVKLLFLHGASPRIAYRGDPVIQLIYQYKWFALIEEQRTKDEFAAAFEIELPKFENKFDVVGCMELALSKGAKIDAVNRRGETLLHLACKDGDQPMAEFCLDRGADVNKRSQTSTTALHLASIKGSASVCELLLRKGAEIDARDRHGRTSLHLAVEHRRGAVVTLLIGQHASVLSQDAQGKSALHILCQSGESFEICETIASQLLQAGASIAALDRAGKTPLHSPQLNGQLLSKLAERAEHIDAEDRMGFSPLDVACQLGRTALITHFFSLGADPERVNNLGLKPLEMVPQNKTTCLIELFNDFAHIKKFFSTHTANDMQNRYLCYGGLYLGTFLLNLGITSFLGMPLLALPLQLLVPNGKDVAKDVYADYSQVRAELRNGSSRDIARALPKFIEDVYVRQNELKFLLQELRNNPNLLIMHCDNDANPLEVAFLFGDFVLMQKLKETVGRKFDEYVVRLKTKYPKMCAHLVDECTLYPNRDTLLQASGKVEGDVAARLKKFKREIVQQIAQALLQPLTMHRHFPDSLLEKLQERLTFKLIEILSPSIGIDKEAYQPFFLLDKILSFFVPDSEPRKNEGIYLGLFWTFYNSHRIISLVDDYFNSMFKDPASRQDLLAGVQQVCGELLDLSTNRINRSYTRNYLIKINLLQTR